MTKGLTSLLCLVFTMIFSHTVQAQYTEIGQNSFTSNLYGPAVVSTSSDSAYSRHAYIYRKEVLGQLVHGDTIRSLAFFKDGTNRYSGNTRFRIYLDMSDTADFGFGKLHWPNETQKTGCVLVYEGNLASVVTQQPGFQRFEFNQSGGKFAFDTTRGEHLKILVEYIQHDAQTANIPWSYENNITVPGFVSNNETKYIIGRGLPADSTNNSNVRKPYIRINFPRHSFNLNVFNVYALGKLPLRMGKPDTVKVLVSNDGLATTYNRKFYMTVSGANSYLDSITVDSLVPYQEKMVYFTGYTPKNEGKEELLILPEKDNFQPNDTGRFERMVNLNVFAHTNPYQPMDGGVGFNGQNGDFVAKFYSDTGNYINQISVEFFSSGEPFQLGIWGTDSNGLPGKELFMSDTFFTKAGQFILPVLPRIKVDTAFFAGIRQDTTTNLAFGFQWESPIRPDVFYFTTPTGNTQWTSFSPGYDFNFNIQPRIQVANDVSVTRAVWPKDGEVIELSVTDSTGPIVTVHNFGFRDQDIPFDVVCEIRNQFGQLVYTSTKSLTLDANDSAQVAFDTSFRLYNHGPNNMVVYTKLSSDRVYDNDTLMASFEIVISHDVSADAFFEPLEGATYQMNRDSIWPIIRVLNNGIVNKNVTKVGLRVYQGSFIISQQVRFVNLDAESSQIVAFDTIVLNRNGQVTFEAFVYQPIDSFRSNDTIRVNVNVIKDDDIAMLNIIRPQPGSVYNTNTTFKPFIDFRNVGRATQDSVLTWCEIRNARQQLLFRDSMVHNITFQSTKQALFKDFKTPAIQDTLTATFWVYNEDDQDPTNNTMSSIFYTAIGNDLAVRRIHAPVPDTIMEVVISKIYPSATLISQGKINIAATDQFNFYCEVIQKGAPGSPYYSDTLLVSNNELSFGDSIEITWNKLLELNDEGSFDIRVWHDFTKDELVYNDTLIESFTVSKLRSIVLQEVIQPRDSAYELNLKSFTPKIRLQNNGLEDIPQFTTGGLTIHKNQQKVYEDDFVIGPLKSMEEKTVTYDASFTPVELGTYDVVAWLSNPVDLNTTDDTIRFSFDVYKRYDITPVLPVYPGNEDSVVYLETYRPTASFRNVGDSAVSSTFSVSFQIFDGTSLIYNSNKSVNGLDTNETKLVEFDSSFKVWFKGEGTSMIITRYGNDQNKLNDTLIQTFIAADFVSVPKLEKLQGVTVYPNPVNDILVIDFKNNPGAEGYQLSVYDAKGIKVLEKDMETGQRTADLGGIKEGMYFVRIITKDGRTSVIPIIKK